MRGVDGCSDRPPSPKPSIRLEIFGKSWLISSIDSTMQKTTVETDMTTAAIALPIEKIADFCHHWQVSEFALFGSVLRDDFRPESDIDVMVQFHPDAHPTFGTLDQMEADLKVIFHREVDLITRKGIESSRNYLRRKEILSSAQVIVSGV